MNPGQQVHLVVMEWPDESDTYLAFSTEEAARGHILNAYEDHRSQGLMAEWVGPDCWWSPDHETSMGYDTAELVA